MAWRALAAASLLVAVLLGSGFAYAELSGRNVPIKAGLIHGAAALLAMVVLGVAIATGSRSLPLNAALLLAAMAAMVGLLLFAFRYQRETPPAAMIFFHACIGVTALVLAVRAWLI